MHVSIILLIQRMVLRRVTNGNKKVPDQRYEWNHGILCNPKMRSLEGQQIPQIKIDVTIGLKITMQRPLSHMPVPKTCWSPASTLQNSVGRKSAGTAEP